MFLWIADGDSLGIKLVICNLTWCLTSPETPPKIKSKDNDSTEDKEDKCLQQLFLKIFHQVVHRGDYQTRLIFGADR